jgi:hypothetical protein
MAVMDGIAKQFVFQLEQGDSGYEHYQGRLSLIKKRRAAEKHILLNLFKDKPEYLAVTSNPEHLKGDNFYVLKEDTRLEGPWSDKDKPKERFLPYQYDGIADRLYPWQKQIRDSAAVREPRLINVIYDPTGCCGKSSIAAIMEILDDCIDMPPLNDFKDIVALAHDICKDTGNRDPKVMFFDMPRAMGKDKLVGFYSAIEQIKKGKLYDIRYKYSSWWIHSPQVWVFTNVFPDLAFQSMDRWRVWEISSEKTLVRFSPPNIYNNV